MVYRSVYNFYMNKETAVFNSRNKLFKAALKIFSEKGYDNAGVFEIAAAAGVTKPTLYHFFGNKEGLFREILNHYYEKFLYDIAIKAVYKPNLHCYEEDIYPVLCEVACVYFNFARKQRIFYLMTAALIFSGTGSVAYSIAEPFIKRQFAVIKDLFVSFSAFHGNLKGKENELAFNFVALINSSILLWHRGYADIDNEKVHFIVKQFMHGIFA